MMMELRDLPESGLSLSCCLGEMRLENEKVIMNCDFRLGNMDIPGLAMSRSLGDTVAHSGILFFQISFIVIVLFKQKREFTHFQSQIPQFSLFSHSWSFISS